ncbi:MAG: hypothetical protein AAF684_09315, partial [Pseudomonadota bacterium]
DVAGELRFRERMSKATQGKTLIMVTHRTALLPLFTHLLVMDQGRLIGFGPRDAVLAQLNANTQPAAARA